MIHGISPRHIEEKSKQSPALVCVLTDHEMYALVPNGDFT